MSESSTDQADAASPHQESEDARSDPQWQPGVPFPDPREPAGPTSWGAATRDWATSADGLSSWSAADEPGAVPPPIATGPGRVGWLLAGREPSGGPGAG